MEKRIYKPKAYKWKTAYLKTAKMIRFVATKEQGIRISFPFIQKDIDRVKTLFGRRYYNNGKDRYWTCPLTITNLENLYGWKFKLDIKLLNILNEHKLKSKQKKIPQLTEVPGLRKTLMPFQFGGVSFLDYNKGRGLIADDMGLGKTMQALAYLQLHPEKRPVIIVTPASLKLNWKHEAITWLSKPEIQVLSGTDITIPLLGQIIVINYDILYAWVSTLLKIKPKVCIFDESHYFKNNKAKRTKAVMRLAKNIKHVIALSGTPIVNKPMEFFNVLKLIDPYLFPNRWLFGQRYCGAKNNGWGWTFDGSENAEELHQILTSSVMIRRRKKDVLKELPDKVFSMIPMELENQNDYNLAEVDFVKFIQGTVDTEVKSLERKLANQLDSFMKEHGIEEYDFGTHTLNEEKVKELKREKVSNINVLTEIEALKQLAVKGKMKQTINWITDFLESGEKLVIFANHKFVINQLMEEFGKVAVKIDGSVSIQKRHKVVEEFQTNKNIRLFVGNIKAAGVGLTLTAASNVAILELPWTSGDLIQATDRCHRIGQKDTVNVYYLLAAGTIEEKIAKLLDTKQKILDAILDGKVTKQENLITELINLYKTKK